MNYSRLNGIRDFRESNGLPYRCRKLTKYCFLIPSGSPKINGKTIRYVGEADQDQKIELLQGAKALLFPTQYDETFGLVMAEAMSCGTPVISKPLDKNFFEDGFNILYYNQTRSPSLCDCITTVLEKYSYRERLISEGHNCAKQFDPSDSLQYFDRIINEELANEDTIPVTI